jgi:excisionase family DNA binding protein
VKRDAITIDDLRRSLTCSIDEAAALLGIGRSTAYAGARDGSLPTLKVAHRLLVPTAKLLAMLGYDAAQVDQHDE